MSRYEKTKWLLELTPPYSDIYCLIEKAETHLIGKRETVTFYRAEEETASGVGGKAHLLARCHRHEALVRWTLTPRGIYDMLKEREATE